MFLGPEAKLKILVKLKKKNKLNAINALMAIVFIVSNSISIILLTDTFFAIK